MNLKYSKAPKATIDALVSGIKYLEKSINLDIDYSSNLSQSSIQSFPLFIINSNHILKEFHISKLESNGWGFCINTYKNKSYSAEVYYNSQQDKYYLAELNISGATNIENVSHLLNIPQDIKFIFSMIRIPDLSLVVAWLSNTSNLLNVYIPIYSTHENLVEYRNYHENDFIEKIRSIAQEKILTDFSNINQ